MDLASSERFIELIDSRLVTAETKFIVTHNQEFRGYFEDQIRVVKKNGIAKVRRL